MKSWETSKRFYRVPQALEVSPVLFDLVLLRLGVQEQCFQRLDQIEHILFVIVEADADAFNLLDQGMEALLPLYCLPVLGVLKLLLHFS
jgi:hypothetical protein